MQTVLIAGASRGLGLEFVRQYLEAGDRVLAGCRRPEAAEALQTLAAAHPDRCELFTLDVTDDGSVTAAAAHFAGIPVDLLLVNAGISGQRDGRLGTLDLDSFQETLAVNAVAPYRVIQAFAPSVRAGTGRRIIIVSSRLGSLTHCNGGGVIYRASKAAVNMVGLTLARELTDEGIIICPVHPGWVRTDMGGPQASLSAQESVEGLRAVIAGLGPEDSGRFLQWDGTELPW